MRPEFEVNEIARIMVTGVIIRIHEIFVTEDDLGDRDKAIKYVVVARSGAVLRSLDERMIMKEVHQEYGKDIPMAGDMDVSKEILLEATPVKVDKLPESKFGKQKYKKKGRWGKRKAKPKTTRTRKTDKDNPFKEMPDF